MTKRRVKTLLALISLMLFSVTMFIVSPATAFAKTTNYDDLKIIYFDQGCQLAQTVATEETLDKEANERIYPMRYTLTCKDKTIGNFSSLIKQLNTGEGTHQKYTYQTFTFTLLRIDQEGSTPGDSNEKATPLYSLRFLFSFRRDLSNDIMMTISEKQYDYGVSKLVIDNTLLRGAETLSTVPMMNEKSTQDGFSVVYRSRQENNGPTELFDKDGKFYITANVNSPTQLYAIKMTYDFRHTRSVGFMNLGTDDYYYNGTARTSEDRSIQRNLELMRNNDQENFESQFSPEVFNVVKEIITCKEKKEVTLTYLVPIEGTPFYKREHKKATLLTFGTSINRDDVYSATGIESFTVGKAFLEKWTYDEEKGVYVAEYYKDEYLKSVTKDGDSLDYFFDINQSFYDHFYPKIARGYLEEAQYEYAFSEILESFPQLERMGPSEIYGRFGYVMLPETKFTLNALLIEILGNDPKTLGVSVQYEYTATLTHQQYTALLEDYNYNAYTTTFEPIINELVGEPLRAKAILLYSTGRGIIDENEGGPIDKIKETVQNAWGFLSNITTNLTGLFKDMTNTRAGSAITFIGIAFVAGVGVYIYLKIKGKGKRRK